METDHPSHPYTIPLAIVVAGGLIALSIYAGGSSAPVAGGNNVAPEISLPAVTSSDHLLGNADAPVKLVEYSDTECPFCKSFHNTIKQVLNSYPSQVALVYRHFPIPQLHSKAMKEAEALECAGELGGDQIFWNYLDQVFLKTNSNDSLDPAELPKIALALGLDVSAFNSCLSSGKYTKAIQDSMTEAVKAGARGTPYSVLVSRDGTKIAINGAEPFESIKTKIDSLLK